MGALSAVQWDWVYFISCFLGTICITYVFKASPYKVIVFILMCSFGKEVSDLIASELNVSWMIKLGCDARGYYIMDNVRAIAGCTLGFIVLVFMGLRQMQ
jgi:hypothetical protein